MPDLGYRLTREADSDLERIYEWGIDQFGPDQADRYFDALTRRFEDIARNPLARQAVEHIRVGYRRSVFAAHSIYFRVEEEGVLMVRILGRQNVQGSLPEL